ncbi:MAG TPA: prephenate dehydrogenase/arogenate dehydrogenase family protein [Caldilineae bacterium]|jgi:prephenate dehydrogenase|nr:prephenate dehydrogenase/arogenate dehydrogenase family protein [Caldilineae bacterium]
MAKAKITIIGLGVVGSSLGMALRQGHRDYEVVGHDKEPKVAAAARKAGAVDRTDWNLISACENADLIILALPVAAIRDTMEHIAEILKPGCVVTDTASIKVPVLRWAEELLPHHAHFVGGDPIISAPEDATGVEAASAELLRDAIYCLCPTATAVPEAVEVIADLVSRVGARPLFLDAAEHDGLTAGVDHLPTIMAAALLEITALTAPWREMRKLAGGQYQAATHFASEDAAAYRAMVLANKDNVLHWIDTLIENLRQWRQRVANEEGEALEEAFQQVLDARNRWLRQKASGQWEEGTQVDMGEVPGYWRSLLGFGRPSRKREP